MIRALLLDLEGTVYADGSLLPGAVDALESLRSNGFELRFLTNRESASPSAVVAELEAMGLGIAEAELITPLLAAQSALAGKHVLPVMDRRLVDSLVTLVDSPAEATAVLVGDVRDLLTYQLLDDAFFALENGAELWALQRGRFFLRGDRRHLDTGAIVAALEYSSGTSAHVLGKPSRAFFDHAVKTTGKSASECLVVGDDATTDIAGARGIGAHALLVRTGKWAAQSRLPEAQQVATIPSIADLPAWIAETSQSQ